MRNDLLRAPGRTGFRGLRTLALEAGQELHVPGERLRHVWFPTGAVVSLITARPPGGGHAVEASLVGSEGMVGVSLALGVRRASTLALVQASGTAQHASAEQFLQELRRSGALRRRVLRFSDELAALVLRTLACDRNHAAVPRLARWLLMMHERSARTELELTQQVLSRMLGIRRAGAGEAAARLQQRGLIRYSRGRIRILDAPGLERTACACRRDLGE